MKTVMCANYLWGGCPPLPKVPLVGGARRRSVMDGIIYLVGLIVIIMFILSFLGLH